FSVYTVAEAADKADVVTILQPDELQPAAYDSEIAPHIESGNSLASSHGFSVDSDRLKPSPTVDVCLVAPK
ncbi:ketol-acid reductoisomerase, partial [Bacillus cereus]|nr:ketol-acid reductoisomerase [Bacillus cereus]